MDRRTHRVGRITVAAGLVALGVALLMDNLLASGLSYTGLVIRFWPVLLIGLGAEYLVYALLERGEAGQRTRLRFDLGGTFLLLFVLLLAAGYNSLSNWISLNPRDYISPVAIADRSETASLPADGAREVEILVDLGRVELFSQRLNEVRVEATYGVPDIPFLKNRSNLLGGFRLTAEGGEVVRVHGEAPGGGAAGVGNLSATYRIYVPAGLKVRVRTGAGSILVQGYDGDLSLNSRLGSLSVSVSTGRLDLETGSGSVLVEDYTGPVVARTSVGRIDVNRVTGALQLDSGTGSIHVDEFNGSKLVAETRTGSVQVATSTPPEGNMLLRTSTGSLNLTLPSAADVRVTAQTRTGSITAPPFVTVTKNGTAQSAVGVAGSGKHVVTLETGLGSIHFTNR